MSRKTDFSIAIWTPALQSAKRRLFYANCRRFFGFGSTAEVAVRRAFITRIERRIAELREGPKPRKSSQSNLQEIA